MNDINVIQCTGKETLWLVLFLIGSKRWATVSLCNHFKWMQVNDWCYESFNILLKYMYYKNLNINSPISFSHAHTHTRSHWSSLFVYLYMICNMSEDLSQIMYMKLKTMPQKHVQNPKLACMLQLIVTLVNTWTPPWIGAFRARWAPTSQRSGRSPACPAMTVRPQSTWLVPSVLVTADVSDTTLIKCTCDTRKLTWHLGYSQSTPRSDDISQN